MHTGNDIQQLLLRRLQGLATAEEDHRIEAWAAETPENRAVLERLETEALLKEDLGTLIDLVDSPGGEARLMRMRTHIQRAITKQSVRKLRRWLPYVAAVVLAFAVGILIYQVGSRQSAVGNLAAADIAPGGNRATLKLADGQTIDLSAEQSGIIVAANGILYNNGDSLVGNWQGAVGKESSTGTEKGSLATDYYVLSTPKGGTYQITLPDGSKVWLNAASTLKYPSRFSADERLVEVSGEAYFSVVRDESKPFKVASNGQQIEVLGTEFNISAYGDEAEIKTTLVEGAVEIVNLQSNIVNKLKPGEQSIIREAATDIRKVDIECHTAWKNGYFYFKHTPFEEVMRQLSRWYDVEVVYKANIPQDTFSGEMDRDLTLNAVLKLLNASAVQVQIADGNRLIVY